MGIEKTKLYWLTSNEAYDYINKIEHNKYDHKIVNTRIQQYVVFPLLKKPHVKIAWPTINHKIYHNVDQVEYFRYDEHLQSLITHDDKEKILFPCVVKLNAENVIIEQDFFNYYNPHIVNYPMRIVLEENDPEKLEKAARDFVVDTITHECLIDNNRAYIEYVPDWAGKLVDVIPDHYWEIKVHNVDEQLSVLQR